MKIPSKDRCRSWSEKRCLGIRHQCGLRKGHGGKHRCGLQMESKGFTTFRKPVPCNVQWDAGVKR